MTPVKLGIWYFGCASWLFGLSDRALAAFTDGRVSAQEFLLMGIASGMAIGWLCLVPKIEGGDH